MVMSSFKPPIPQSKVPNVKQLCEVLGFGHLQSRLKETTQTFRKQYINDDGVLGRTLTEWNDGVTNRELAIMAARYLNIYGRELWSANTSCKLQYPKDSNRIRDLLVQLFWKENTHEAHNAKHPDRGRRVRESVESDQSSTTVASPSLPTLPRSKYLPVRAPPPTESKPNYPGIGVGSVPKGPFRNTLPRSELAITTNKNVEGPNTAASTQSSGSLFVPRDEDTDEASTAPQGSTQTLVGSSPDLPDDIFAWPGDDSKRPAKTKATKLITSSFRHPWKTSEDDTAAATTLAPVAKMQTTPVPVQRTPKKSRTEKISPASKTTNVEAGEGKTSAEANRRRGRDVDGDDEDAEYIPRPRSKRQKANSNASDNAPALQETRLSDPELRPSPTRQLATAIEDATLPTRPIGKPPVTADNVPHNIEDRVAIPESPLNDEELDDPTEQAEEHLRTFLSRPSARLPQESPDRAQHAEPSLPSPISNAAAPEPISPRPSVPFRSINDAGDLYSRGSSLERPLQRQPQPPPPAPPIPEINYYITAKRGPRLSKIHWPSGSLANRTLSALFTEVAAAASIKGDLQRIACKLTTSTSDIQYTITRTDDKIYDIMKKEFSRDINADLARGNTEFDIELRLEPGKVMVPVETEERRIDFRFSF